MGGLERGREKNEMGGRGRKEGRKEAWTWKAVGIYVCM